MWQSSASPGTAQGWCSLVIIESRPSASWWQSSFFLFFYPRTVILQATVSVGLSEFIDFRSLHWPKSGVWTCILTTQLILPICLSIASFTFFFSLCPFPFFLSFLHSFPYCLSTFLYSFFLPVSHCRFFTLSSSPLLCSVRGGRPVVPTHMGIFYIFVSPVPEACPYTGLLNL